MDNHLENKIIATVKSNIEKYGVCSIKQAAEISFCPDLKLSDQKRLAKRIVKEFSCTTEINKGEVLVRRNEHRTDLHIDTAKEYDWLKALITLLAAAFGFVLFKIILPRL